MKNPNNFQQDDGKLASGAEFKVGGPGGILWLTSVCVL